MCHLHTLFYLKLITKLLYGEDVNAHTYTHTYIEIEKNPANIFKEHCKFKDITQIL